MHATSMTRAFFVDYHIAAMMR